MPAMLSVIIATGGIEQPAVATLAALVPGAAAGVVREVLLIDRPGSDTMIRVADVAGCLYGALDGSPAEALAAGAARARSPWLMFLHAGAVLEAGWIEEATSFMQAVQASDRPRAGVFRYARSPHADTGWRDHIRRVALTLGAACPDQGLLIARGHYERLGGYGPDARSEARLLRRLRGSSRTLLRTRIVVT